MRLLRRFCNRHPWFPVTLILLTMAISIWAVTDYLQNTVWPRQQAARRAGIDEAIAQADAKFARARYDAARQAYQYVLGTFGADLTPVQQGRLWQQTGLCLLALGKARDQPQQLAAALEALHKAQIIAPATGGTQHALIDTQLGDTYRALALAENQPGTIDQALQAYQLALDVYTAAAQLPEQAATLNRLGDAYQDLYRMKQQREAQQQALAFYQQALAVLDGQPYPLETGQTWLALGQAQVTLAQTEQLQDPLTKAIDMFEHALDTLTAEAYPQEYASVQQYLGDTYTLLAEAGPRRGTSRALHEQKTFSYKRKAQTAYHIAQQFGIQTGRESK
jgi:tetratricopeptide (TPR) repeat protein